MIWVWIPSLWHLRARMALYASYRMSSTRRRPLLRRQTRLVFRLISHLWMGWLRLHTRMDKYISGSLSRKNVSSCNVNLLVTQRSLKSNSWLRLNLSSMPKANTSSSISQTYPKSQHRLKTLRSRRVNNFARQWCRTPTWKTWVSDTRPCPVSRGRSLFLT